MTLATLKLLAQQAAAATDAAAANDVLGRAAAIASDESLPASREVAMALINVAGALVPLGAPGGVEELFHAVQRMLVAAGGALVDDQLLIWHNLGVLYRQHGANDLCNQTLALVGQLAETWNGPLQPHGAGVFLEQGLTYRRNGQTEPMLTMLRQVHRQRSSDATPPAERLVWLTFYAPLLLEAQRPDEALPLLSQGAALARQLGEAQSEVHLLNTHATFALSRSDVDAALAALERALPLIDATPALAHSRMAAAVLHNLVAARLNAAEPSRYAEALAHSERVIDLLRRLGQADSGDFAQALYQHAVLIEYLGDWVGAARGYAAAAAVHGVDADAATDWLSLGGRAWFEAGEFDAASDCYLAAVRRRLSAPAPAV